MDDNDKTRRNLVVFSGAVILVAWLELPVHVMLQEALKGGALTVGKWRPWAAAAAIETYLALRYRFSAEAGDFLKEMRGTRWETRERRIHALLGAAFGESLKSLTVNRFGDVDLPERLKSARAEHPRIADWSSVEYRHSVRPRGGPWEGTVEVQYMMPPQNLLFASREFSYSIPLMLRVRIATASFLRTWIYAKHSVNLALPGVLAAVAGLVIVYKLVQAALLP